MRAAPAPKLSGRSDQSSVSSPDSSYGIRVAEAAASSAASVAAANACECSSPDGLATDSFRFHTCTPAEGTEVRRLGYTFTWSASHPRVSSLVAMRARGDAPVDQLLLRLKCGFNEDCMAIVAQRAARHKARTKEAADSASLGATSSTNEDAASVAATAASSAATAATAAEIAIDAECFQFLLTAASVPSWVDWDRVSLGQTVFRRYCPAGLLILLYSSLLGGFGAPLINEVLEATQSFTRSCPATYSRLIETTLMVVAAMGPDTKTLHPAWTDESIPLSARPPTPPPSATPAVTAAASTDGDGWMACLRVRFLHAQVRKMLLNRSKGWNIAAYGVPINQEDQAVTLLSFSFNLLHKLERLGIRLSSEEREAYMHTWRYLGWLMGVEQPTLDGFMSSYAAGLRGIEGLIFHLVWPDASSQQLAQHVVQSVTHCSPLRWSFDFHVTLARTFLGDEWADALHMPPSTRWCRVKARVMFGLLRITGALSCMHPILGRFFDYLHFTAPNRMATRRFGAFVLKQQKSKMAVLAANQGQLQYSSSISVATAATTSLAPTSTVGLHSAHPLLTSSTSGAAASCPFLASQLNGAAAATVAASAVFDSPAAAAPAPLEQAPIYESSLPAICKEPGCTNGGRKNSHGHNSGSSSILFSHPLLLFVLLLLFLLCIALFRFPSLLFSAPTDSFRNLLFSSVDAATPTHDHIRA